ncbi:MAG: hypothetical protein DRH51_01845 [Candidatus Coatesbacteria bacterium]|nr:MAG: hypothetical protein DRH51_01845 [Candidatus Coatesbacteria bacterium]RLC43238.1 MAG: hypothetical protein DRH49_01820 [Candidatus Coatesbacteria bacterium]RLC44823.1 MAG: hypothetical protein DRH44_01060 [Candidatus Coatesbacteria bacterium]
MRKFVSLFVFLLLSNIAMADGGRAGAFMRVGVDPVVMAMGFSGTTYAPSVSSSYWNPAILGFNESNALTASMTRLSMDRMLYYSLVAVNLGEAGGIGGGWIRGEVKDIDARNTKGNKFDTFNYPQDGFLFSFGRSFGGIVGVGVTYVQHHYDLYDVKANGSQLNVGCLFDYKGFRAGFTIDNLYSNLDWDAVSMFGVGRNEKFPLRFRAGSGIRLLDGRLVSTGEVWFTRDVDTTYHLGAEVWASEDIVFRGGLNDGNFTMGGGLRFAMSKVKLNIEYSYIKDNLDVADGHSVAIVFLF